MKIGFIGPIMSTVSVATGGKSHEEALGIKMLQGAQLAIEEANARGGYLKRKIPFELVVSNDNGLWGASGNEIINMAYKDNVWAILGTIDGANSHIAIRVALKVEILMMNTGDTDPTFIETNIPWVMRCIGDDRQMGYLLVDYIYPQDGAASASASSAPATATAGSACARSATAPAARSTRSSSRWPTSVGTEDFSPATRAAQGREARRRRPLGRRRESALILNQMREMGMNQPFFACDRCVSDEFAKIAGENAEGVICGYPWNPDRKDPKLDAFRAALPQALRTRSPKPTPPTPTTA